MALIRPGVPMAVLFTLAIYLGSASCRQAQPEQTGAPIPTRELEQRPIQEITPADQFFIIQKGATPPQPDIRTWRLQVKGLVRNPLSLSLPQIEGMRQREEIVTIECIENPPGQGLIGTGRWRGVLLKDVLESARVHGRPRTIIFRAADGYEESIPYDFMSRSPAMLVTKLNGQPLAMSQGYPIRLIAPGLYGMKQTKWIQSIEVSDQDFRGFWEKRGWSAKGEVFVKSWIYRVDASPESPDDRIIRGVAFAGLPTITRLDVSVDGGRTWRPAVIDKVVGPYAWSIWSYRWVNPAPGAYVLAVRARDSAGRTQPVLDPDISDGNNGIQSVTYSVKDQ